MGWSLGTNMLDLNKHDACPGNLTFIINCAACVLKKLAQLHFMDIYRIFWYILLRIYHRSSLLILEL